MNTIPIANIKAGNNDRYTFKDSEIEKLAISIKANGLVQQILLRRIPQLGRDQYEIVAGERRFRALLSLGYTELNVGEHVRIEAMEDELASAAMLIENVMRQDLNPIEEAKAYQKRIDLFGWSIEDIAINIGVSPITVQFRLKLLKLREDIQHLIASGSFPMGYAQILSDANLDRNRQLIALRQYQEVKNPTTGWFRLQVNKLADQQHQEAMFADPIAPALTLSSPALPADPRTDSAPADGDDWLQVVESHVAFWEAQGAAWADLGKTFKKQECEAVIKALNTLLWAIEPVLEEEQI